MLVNVVFRLLPTVCTAANDHDRNASGNQTVFDRGGAGLVLQKRCSWVLENLVII